jgi:hypothetical protein
MRNTLTTLGPLLAWVVLACTACEGQAVVFSNAFLMGLTCFMLWSTLNLRRGDRQENR